MTTTDRRLRFLVAAPVAVLALAGPWRGAAKAADEKDVTVSLCDGQSQLTVPGLKPGQELGQREASKVAVRGRWRRSWARRLSVRQKNIPEFQKKFPELTYLFAFNKAGFSWNFLTGSGWMEPGDVPPGNST